MIMHDIYLAIVVHSWWFEMDVFKMNGDDDDDDDDVINIIFCLFFCPVCICTNSFLTFLDSAIFYISPMCYYRNRLQCSVNNLCYNAHILANFNI